MGITRKARGLPELLEATGDPESAATIRAARAEMRAPKALGASHRESFFEDEGEDDSDFDSEDDYDEESDEESDSDDGGSEDSAGEHEAGVGQGEAARAPADTKRAAGTDEERAERLARMMAAQCNFEPPEKVGLHTGWKPSTSGFGVTRDER
jgi:hypothetical protein